MVLLWLLCVFYHDSQWISDPCPFQLFGCDPGDVLHHYLLPELPQPRNAPESSEVSGCSRCTDPTSSLRIDHASGGACSFHDWLGIVFLQLCWGNLHAFLPAGSDSFKGQQGHTRTTGHGKLGECSGLVHLWFDALRSHDCSTQRCLLPLVPSVLVLEAGLPSP